MRLTIMFISAVWALTLSMTTSAHRAWLEPSATVLSGEDALVTVDAAISNTLFHPDHVAMSLEGIKVTAPDGTNVEMINAVKGRYRSVFDVPLAQQGTYKIASASGGLRAFWRDEAGNRKMWPGRGQQANEADFASAVPANATDLTVSRGWRRVETFVTVGAPTKEVLQPVNQGLELVPLTHPNDLYTSETATFKLLIDGEPAKGAEVAVVPGGMRYRDSQQVMTLTSNSQGEISITWPHAGMYFLEASYQDNNVARPATVRTGSYSATFEVLPL
ncbi:MULTISPECIES: DUF4198 domain-containing protein [unclassified Arsukibacterium]|uniref:DUF4198 domain-containing protein n=1 Tax=unclassified Arsukibacterium TaxID=2635278 RepID=UPI000C5E65C5|nr:MULTISPECIES: DUF4198 domain-containing protein [unclassified Arsukibacterium]MBM35178.1 ABC transporter permease [Rheinheimera sp.]HAW94106.1 DUF4198 domain-containing protein [Candidatus Azambacteria bacterium]|tara:strand:+ start:7145 stop:7969 length:825 start_codon:yes stop_codon:yes gene_type:complete